MSISRLAGIDMNLLVVLDALLTARNATRAATHHAQGRLLRGPAQRRARGHVRPIDLQTPLLRAQ